MVSILIDFLLIAIILAIALGSFVYMIFSIISYNNTLSKESTSCSLYSCGFDDEDTHKSCSISNTESQPQYAYRANISGEIECQKDVSKYFDQYVS